ncbi:MAG: hypothetical protein ABJB34_03395 [Acidobacteriota bacterium]
MKNTLKKIMGLTTLAILAVAISASHHAYGQQSSKGETSDQLITSGKGARALEGSWSAVVTFRVCATGDAIRSFPSMATYMQGGTMQEFGVGAAPLPRGPGHGKWDYVGDGDFTSAFQFFRFNADGSYAGYSVAHRQMQMNADATSYTATSAVSIYNPAGVQVGSGCGTEVATRFE